MLTFGWRPALVPELRLAVVLAAMFTLPGWALLTVGHVWHQWNTLQRWCLAVAISVAVYPVLFYGMRFVLPMLTLGPYKMAAMLLGCAVMVVWRMRKCWREQFAFDRLEWVAIGLFGATLFTRFWIIRDHPYPAWADSLHHAILTQLTAVQGRLPASMEPYFPVPLGQYHLGLYSLSASVEWLAQVPAHTALLWTAQALNGLCGLGVYLVLDRKVGRLGAVVGAAVVGLLSHQPALYVNWGRFTQISSQAVLLVAWMLTWGAIVSWKQSWSAHKVMILWNTGAAALLTSAVFLLHFRVAWFYLPLLAISIGWELWRARPEHQVARILLGMTIIGICALILVFPTLREALQTYVVSTTTASVALSPGERAQTTETYFEFPWSSMPYLAAHVWLVGLAALSAVLGMLRRNKLVIASLLWSLALWLIGNTYLLGVSLLNLTNLGAVLIMLYLPIGLIIGAAAEELITLFEPSRRTRMTNVMLGLVLAASFVASHVRITEIEPYRYFVTPADVVAMDWIRANTPQDARFAVNTTFWLPDAPHGTDAGYWIPYFTGRQTSVGSMMSEFGGQSYMSNIVEMSRAEERLEMDDSALGDLRNLGVDYIYIGQRGDFAGPGLDARHLSQVEGVKVVYQRDGVSILKIGKVDKTK
jgi:hypothetical protein